MNILLIEAAVLITIGWATTLLVMKRKWLRQRQAWQWWQAQQIVQSHHKAESIRDGLLQQTFAFRRYLETIEKTTDQQLANLDQLEADQTKRWLERFQTFHHTLESLSNELSSPFVDEGLPLALQFAIKNWQQTQSASAQASPPTSTLKLSLPSDWPQGSPQQNQIILSVAIALLTLLIPPGSPSQPLHISLSREETRHTLIIELNNDTNQTLPKISELAEIQHLKEIFHSLAAGQLDISQQERAITARLRWRDCPQHLPQSH